MIECAAVYERALYSYKVSRAIWSQNRAKSINWRQSCLKQFLTWMQASEQT